MIFRSVAVGVALVVTGLGPLRAQDAAPAPAPVEDNDQSPYHVALVDYKTGKFQEAYDALKGVDAATQDDNFILLDARVLTELKKYSEAEALLKPGFTGPDAMQYELVEGDLLVRKRSFDHASRYYSAALKAQPKDPDIKLKLVYAWIGANDLPRASQMASDISPSDPKNPYDVHASYYFAKAALARATGDTAGEEAQIQQARTLYGITVTNHYLKEYLEFFATLDKGSASALTPPPKKDSK